MTFKNEYVPKPEEEASEYFKAAREALQKTVIYFDKWAVDRQNNMALVRAGCGSDRDSANQEYWRFIEAQRVYGFSTRLLAKRKISEKVLHLERSITFHAPAPEASLVPHIKAALQAFGDWGVISDYESFELVLKTTAGKAV